MILLILCYSCEYLGCCGKLKEDSMFHLNLISCLRKNSLCWEVLVMWSKQIFHLIVLLTLYVCQYVYVSLCMSLLPLKCACTFF